MRTLTGLRRRRPENAANDTVSVTPDPAADPPMIAALVQPMLALRASLGSGATLPDRGITTALSAAANRAADSEAPHRDGLHALESTWTSTGADAAVPALRTTQTQLGEISDRGPAYLSVLADAQATSARAARKVDQIIADFRADARVILANAGSAPETDAVIDRAATALREAITTVTAARTEMDGHTGRLDAMGPLTVTTPAGVAGQGGIGGTSTPVTYFANTPSTGYPTTAADGQPLDPALIAQLQLQQQLVSAGVQLGTAAITAGVDIGTHLIDKIVEVGTHAMDTVAASADKAIDKAIPELLNPGSTTNNGAGGQSGGAPSKLIDFGGGTGPSSSAPLMAAPGTAAPAPKTDPPPAEEPEPEPPAGESVPAPEPETPLAQAPFAAEPAPEPPTHQPGTTGGMAMPPAVGGDQDRRPRDGQLGVTVPASEILPETVTVPAAVIGDFGDDAL
ncbi:hypothetical protein [Nocardia farcinica]|uniref:hypothetical protein n=1 Tax=Nocardia farcinica TaxID=37329 RepID=UPI00245871D9|nr:hypothetical protein [Nocardia farcinica]